VLRARFAFDENEGGEHRQVEPVVENQRRFQSAVAEEEAAFELRQALAIFGAVNSSHDASSNVQGVAQGAPGVGKCDRRLERASELVVQRRGAHFGLARHG
jgi:hypothetical protein